MLGKRLDKANKIAKKRTNRYRPEGWEGEMGRLRKEKVICNCNFCKWSRKKKSDKGEKKNEWRNKKCQAEELRIETIKDMIKGHQKKKCNIILIEDLNIGVCSDCDNVIQGKSFIDKKSSDILCGKCAVDRFMLQIGQISQKEFDKIKKDMKTVKPKEVKKTKANKKKKK